MKALRLNARPTLLLLALSVALPAWTQAQQIPSPEDFFGHAMGPTGSSPGGTRWSSTTT